jgi:hypothetical protein
VAAYKRGNASVSGSNGVQTPAQDKVKAMANWMRNDMRPQPIPEFFRHATSVHPSSLTERYRCVSRGGGVPSRLCAMSLTSPQGARYART